MKNIALALSLASVVGTAFAAFSPADNVNVFVTGEATVKYDDNILQTDTGKIDDTIFEINPGVEVTTGKSGSQYSSVLSFSELITRYVDTNGLDTNLANLSLTTKFDNTKTSGSFSAGYRQLNQNSFSGAGSGLTGVLIRRNVITVGGNVETEIDAKSRIGLGLSYEDTSYKTAGLADSQIYSVPLNYYYALSPKLSLSTGFRYRKTNLKAPATDFTDYFYNVGLRGEFTPKLQGSISVGLNQRDPAVGKTQSGLGVDSGVTYNASTKTSYNLNVSNDFSAASAGTSQQTFSISGGAQTQLDTTVVGFANLLFSSVNYSGPRRDNFWQGSLSAKWVLNRYWTVSGGYTYKNNSSNLPTFDFVDNMISVSAEVRY